MEIGGYFSLHVDQGSKREFDTYYRFNLCRNALIVLLNHLEIEHVQIPFYTCEVIHNTLSKHGIQHSFYRIDRNLEIVEEDIDPQKPLLYTNYFGLKDDYISTLSDRFPRTVIDNAQALYSTQGRDAIYCPRKFVGIPDGGLLRTEERLTMEDLAVDHSSGRCDHLFERLDGNTQQGYEHFKAVETSFNAMEPRQMSMLTSSVFDSVDHDAIKKARIENYAFLEKKLKESNAIKIARQRDAVPMVYPFLVEHGKKLKRFLIDRKIFTATYWESVKPLVPNGSFEHHLIDDLVPLPIDQRYGLEDMQFILNAIHSFPDAGNLQK